MRSLRRRNIDRTGAAGDPTGRRFTLALIGVAAVLLLGAGTTLAQTAIQRAGAAYEAARSADAALKAKPPSERTRAEYIEVIRRYERVYLITPHTGYADNALINIAALYEDIDDARDAIRTLEFLVREYPSSRFIATARQDIARLRGENRPADTAGVVPARSDAGPAADPVWVEDIRYWESSKSVRVVVDLDGEPRFTQGEAQNPPRVFVDIHNARVAPSLQQRALPVESVMLQKIRIGQHDRSTVRVVLDLVQLHDVATFSLRDPDRLVIDVLGDAPVSFDRLGAIAATSAPPGPPPGGEPASGNAAGVEFVEAETSPETPVRVSTPARPTADGQHSLIRSLGLKVGTVVIDPGHGGHDTGTIGPSGLMEKELVLDLALGLKERIEVELGAEVLLTRDRDVFVPLEARTAMANQAEADLFLSIHANSSRSQSIRGFETYFLNLATSNADREIAARENAASQASISELQDLIGQILMQDKVEESREFASHIQDALARGSDFGRNRGVKQAPFVVLIGANMPSILAEVSFISNPEDERLLKSDARRSQIVNALFDGVRSYSETLSGFSTAQVED